MGRRSSSDGVAQSSLSPLPPVSSKAKDYSERPDEVVDELDDLRTRGIAKVLNKHFTDTTKHLAMEKAKADSALADLERRRAQTKAFVPSKGGELNPYDQLYVQLQQKRAECRRKEKETMMLYQRYVMKYGKSAKAAPLVVKGEEAQGSTKHPHDGEVSCSKEDTIRSNASVNKDHKGEEQGVPVTGKSALGTLDENSEINFSKFYEKQQGKRSKENENNEENVVHFMSALNKFMTVSGEEQQLVTEDRAVDAASDNSEEAIVPNLVASKDSTTLTDLKSIVDPGSPLNKVNTSGNLICDYTMTTTTTTTMSDKEEEEELEDDDIHSDISTPATDDANEVKVGSDNTSEQFENVTKNIQIGFNSSSEDRNGPSHCKSESIKSDFGKMNNNDAFLSKTPGTTAEAAAIMKNKVGMEVTSETPCFATTTVESYDADDRSIISELTTANSAVTRHILDEVETEIEDFIKNEMEAIRRMLDSEEDSSTMNPSLSGERSVCSSSVMAGDESVKDAEAMALEMQKILNDITKEDASSGGGNDLSAQSANDDEKTTVNVYPYKFEPVIEGEEWYVHFDETYQKEFYVERKTKRTQWEYPAKIQNCTSSDDFHPDSQSVASSRKSVSRRSSRRSMYRKQRKRRRARRLIVSSVALLCVLVTVFYWRMHHPNETIWGAFTAFIITVKNVDMDEAKAYFMEGIVSTKTLVIDQIEYTFTDRREREIAEAARLEAYAKAEKERKAREREAAARRAKEEAKRIAEERAAREKAAREEAAREEAARRRERGEAARLAEIEKLKLKQDDEAVENAVTEIKRSEKEKKGRRPWSCNIPFAYLVPRCFRLANTQPIYKEGDMNCMQ